MNLQTFIERMDSHDLERDKTHIVADLRQLASNRSLLSEHLYHTLQCDGFNTENSLYNAYAFVLHSSQTYTIRLGFWAPVTSKDESQTFIYHLNHTHDFEMYAVGYSGDGYTTIKRDILQRTPLRVGIRPLLGEETTHKLAPGEVLHMRAFYEVHRQLPPRTLSSSLSLLIHPQKKRMTDLAWCFDEHYLPTYPGIAAQETELYERTLARLKKQNQTELSSA